MNWGRVRGSLAKRSLAQVAFGKLEGMIDGRCDDEFSCAAWVVEREYDWAAVT
jgi:hypothetical protein